MTFFKRIGERIIQYLKSFFKRYRILLLVFAALFLINIILSYVSNKRISELYDKNEAARWAENGGMAQVSIFISEDEMVAEDDIKRFDYMLKDKLKSSGVTTAMYGGSVSSMPEIFESVEGEDGSLNEYDEFDRLYTTAYSAQGSIDIVFENRKLEKANAIGVGGNFFLFHPIELVSGGYFNPDDIMKDSVILDEDSAWQLFGSADIVGETVLIGGVPHFVAGVAKKDTGRIPDAAGLTAAYVFMSYDSLSKYGTIVSGRCESKEISEDGKSAYNGGINCIDVVCPNPVRGLAARLSGEALGLDETKTEIIDDTNRFEFFRLLTIFRSFGIRSMQSKAIYYPYWENIARAYEDYLAVYAILRLLCIIGCIIIICIIIVSLYRNKTITLRDIIYDISDRWYDFRVKHSRRHSNSFL